ncbi:LysM peptidoglycan-binding domain-containing protein [Paenibacillus sp. sgz500958]|uniref:LysM peptidoglycan-binding domain-containing protein n=1 Tax=Paenibacillus sp. sgz500958 TaxID=3242475 RepID=UPI0036D3D9FD
MRIHIVKQGDTLYAIAQKHGVPLQKIIEANPQISNPDVLVIGDKVKIPAAPVPVPDNNHAYHKHTVKQGDTLWKLSKAWGITLKDIVEANPQLKNPNTLMIGEVVNIPMKGMSPAGQNADAVASVVDKTQLGGENYTGPIEQPPTKTYTGPIAQPPVKTNTAPIEELPAPVIQEPIKAVEPAPVKETVHAESQSLFVQITVPAQEAVTYHHEMKPAPTPCGCDHAAGYPGLTENPNFYDCPPAYPLYESVNNIQPMYEKMPMYDHMNAPMSQINPMSYAPDYMMPYNYYQNNMYPAAGNPGPWYPNMEPLYTSPQYEDNMPNMPWPVSCGCGKGGQMQPYQVTPYEMSMYNPQPMHPMGLSPYGVGMPNAMLQQVAPMMAGIPSNPEYPGLGNGTMGLYNRVTESQLPPVAEEIGQVSGSVSVDSEAVAQKEGKASVASGRPKVKTSSIKTNKNESLKTQNSRKNKGSAVSKKRRNPWISN